MKKVIISIITTVIIISLCFYVSHLKNQVESRDMYIDYVNDATQQMVNTIYEFDMKQQINLDDNSINVLKRLLKIHPID